MSDNSYSIFPHTLHHKPARAALRRHFVFKKTVHSIVLSLLLIISQNAYTADISQEEIIVTANRYSQSADESLSSVTIINRNDIEKSSAKDLPALLNSVAGFDLKNNGPYGKLSSVFLRGTNSGHTLTLIDGVKLFSASAGSTAFHYIPLDQIERIEIVRGPKSSLYGSEAIGGVIQIFTRKGSGQTKASTNIGYGENNTREISALLSGSEGNARFSLNANHSSTDGIDAIKHSTNNDDDGYINDSISASFAYKFSNMLSFESTFLNAQGNTEYDNCFNNSTFATSDDCDTNFEQQSFSNILKFTSNDLWDGQLLLGRSRDNDENFWESSDNFSFETERIDISFVNNFQLTENQLIVLGLDYAQDTVNTAEYPTSTPDKRDNKAAFIAWDSQYDSFELNISLRNDDNEQFGTHSTGSLSLGHSISNELKLMLSYGSAFKAPTFNDLYFPFFGVDTLNPEESESVELGIKGIYSSAKWSLNVYQTDIDNLIASDPDTFTASNINKAQITGAELISEFSAFKWNMNFSFAYSDAKNQSGINKGKQLVARAKETLNIQADRNYGKHVFSVSLLAQDKRYTNLDNSSSIPGYAIIDASVAYALSKQATLTAKINNIADTEYVINEDSFNGTYNTLGRTLFVNLRYNM